MKNTKIIILMSLSLLSCSHGFRDVAHTEQISPPEIVDLKEASEQILEDVSVLDVENCLPYLTKLERAIDGLKVQALPREQLVRDSFEVSENSWNIRKTLHSKLSVLGEACSKQAQSNFRQLRFVEDYLLEIHYKVDDKTPSEVDFQASPVPMKEDSPYYSVNLVEKGPVNFEPGDILVTRGVSFLSSMIARLGDRGSQFSHIVMIDKNEKNELQTIESYVGKGVSFYALDFALKNENARILWIRAKNKDLAVAAATKMSAKVKARIDAGNHIKYDYELNFKDPSTMSCAEVSQVAYQEASNNEFKIPFYPNTISGAESLMKRLRVPKGETYSPGDMEIDPRFELLGEFKDLRLSRDSRQKDAILTSMYRWMDDLGYQLHDNMESRMAGTVVHALRRTFLWPLVKKMLKLEDFSKEIPRNMLRTVTLVNTLGEAIQVELKKRDEAFEKEHGLPMSYMDFYEALENFRKGDLELYKNKKTRKQSKFHKLFRAP